METQADRLRTARERAGYPTPTEAANAFGWNPVTYRAHENGQNGLRPDPARRYAKAFRVSAAWLLTGESGAHKNNILEEAPASGHIPVIGVIAAGVWQEAEAMYDTGETIPFIPHPRFAREIQRALRISGDSCNRIAPDGSYVNTVPLDHALPADGLEGLLRQAEARGVDLMVVTERTRGGLVEATLKALVRVKGGFALEARSTNPKWSGRIAFDDDMLSETCEVRITRVMIGKYEAML